MQQLRLLCAKSVLLILFAAVCTTAAARPRTTYKKSSGIQHYITLSLSGGEGNAMTRATDDHPFIHNNIGADGQFHIGYELRQRNFLFGIGVGGDYDLHRQRIDSFTDVYSRLDREQDPIYYIYSYRDYKDLQQAVNVSVPIYIGGYLTEELYLLAGVKLGIHVWNTHTVHTELETYGTYQQFIHTIHGAEYFGYYNESHYTYSGAYPAPAFKVTPMLEVGYKIPLDIKNKRIEMRVGGYVEYGIPLSKQNELRMADISRTDVNPSTQNQLNLRDNIILNAPVATDWQKGGNSCNLQVGVRFTCLFNVTPPKKFCMCSPDRKIMRK